jgi:hypothetical protein
MIGFPAPRQKAKHFRFELAGDSFKEELQNNEDVAASSGRALVTVAFGLTDWMEAFGRVGLAEFNLDRDLFGEVLLAEFGIDVAGFKGDFGLAYGGGLRLRLLSLPLGDIGVTGQYLRFTSEDNIAAIKFEGEWEEVDLVVGIGTRRTGAFQFYFGGVYHRSEVHLKVPAIVGQTTLESKIPFRLLLGAHIYPLLDDPSGKLVVMVEARLIGETPQFTLGVQYAF